MYNTHNIKPRNISSGRYCNYSRQKANFLISHKAYSHNRFISAAAKKTYTNVHLSWNVSGAGKARCVTPRPFFTLEASVYTAQSENAGGNGFVWNSRIHLFWPGWYEELVLTLQFSTSLILALLWNDSPPCWLIINPRHVSTGLENGDCFTRTKTKEEKKNVQFSFTVNTAAQPLQKSTQFYTQLNIYTSSLVGSGV